MQKNDQQLGKPQVLYKDTQTNIESLSGIVEGAVAYATDLNQQGTYNGATWDWGSSGGVESVTGDGVDNADPQNPVLSFPTPADIGAQPVDSDLTAIAGLFPSDDDIIQRKAGSWVNRTLSQLITDFTELIQDLIGGMVTGNTETGIDVTYDDAGGKLNFVTTATAETNVNDIFRVDAPGGVSLWTGTISGTPSGTSVTVSAPVTGTEAVLVPTSTSQLAKMRLYNLTRGDYALIANYNTGTNVVTLTTNAPAAWANGDNLTIVSNTVSGGGFSWIDLEITSGLTGKTSMFVAMRIGSGTVNDAMSIHPHETYAASKRAVINNLSTVGGTFGWPIIKINNNVFSMYWTGTPTAIIITESGYLS